MWRSCASAVCTSDAERAERRAGRDRIGGIGRDQQRRLVAAPHRALETARDLDPEQHLAGLQQIVELGDAVHFAGEAEVAGVLQRLQHRARRDRCPPGSTPPSADGAAWC